MERELYFKYLEQTSKLVSSVIFEEATKIAFDDTELKKIMSFYYDKRKNKLLLKPTLFRLSYEICGGTEFEKYIPVAAAFEVINISSYQSNASFDNKMGVLSKSEKDNQFIASMLSRELSIRLLNKIIKDVPEGIIISLNDCISISNLYIYKAQHYDLNILSVKNLDNYKDASIFNNDYHKRCLYGSGIFSGQVALAGAIAANANLQKQESLKKFGEIYGTALHMINDLADFFPDQDNYSKVYQDNFSDIKNGRLTYPIYELIVNYNDQYINILKLLEKPVSNIELMEISHQISKTTIVENVKSSMKNAYNEAKSSLASFQLSDEKKLILALLSVLDSNKFYNRSKSDQL